MRKMFLLKLAVYNVATKKLRAALTVGGIAISVALMTALMGFGSGLESLVNDQINRNELQNVITVSSKTQQVVLDQDAISNISSISGVATVKQVVNLSGVVKFNNIPLNIPIYAVSSEYDEVSAFEMTTGDGFRSESDLSNAIWLSDSLFTTFGIAQPSDTVGRSSDLTLTILQDQAPDQEEAIRTLDAKEYTITGLFQNDNPVGYIELDPLREEGVQLASQLKVLVSNPDQVDSIRENIEQLGFQTTSVTDSIEEAERIFGLIRSVLVYFAVITIAVAVFSTLNTITIELVEQTRQISFLRIMGIAKHEVSSLFIIQSIMLSVVGTLVGVTAGFLLGFTANGVVSAAAAAQTNLDVYIFKPPIFFAVLLLACAVGVGWLIGIVPARRSVAIKPLVGVEN